MFVRRVVQNTLCPLPPAGNHWATGTPAVAALTSGATAHSTVLTIPYSGTKTFTQILILILIGACRYEEVTAGYKKTVHFFIYPWFTCHMWVKRYWCIICKNKISTIQSSRAAEKLLQKIFEEIGGILLLEELWTAA
ncbi:hypothetical protein CBL_11305 [Carabus blaptoides fortunei]